MLTICVYGIIVYLIFTDDINRTRTILQGVAILLAFNKDLIFQNINPKPKITLNNQPAITKDEKTEKMHISLTFARNYCAQHIIKNISVMNNNILIDKMIDSNDQIYKLSQNLEIIISEANPTAVVDLYIYASNTNRIPRLFKISFLSNGKRYSKYIITRRRK